MDSILKISEKEKELRVVKDQVGSPTYAEDLAGAIIGLAEDTTEEQNSLTYHITNIGNISWYKYAEEIIEYAGLKDRKVIPITSEELKRPAARPRMSVLDNNLYKKTTGENLRSYRDALKEYISQKKR